MINFNLMQAIVTDCPVCQQRWVGGLPNEDPKTEEWVKRHGDWHATGNHLPPPRYNGLVLP